MPIIDAQIHPPRPADGWSPAMEPHAIEASAELAAACMDAVGVRAAIVSSTLDNVRGFLERYPSRFGGLPYIGWPAADPVLPPAEHVAEIASLPGVVGVRLVLGRADRFEAYTSGWFDPYIAAAVAHGLPIFLLAHRFLPGIHELLARHGDTTFVVDHLGLLTPPVNASPDPSLFDDLPDVLALARFPNVVLKLTGAPSLSVEPFPFADVWPHVHRLLDAFGVERTMWGSDFTRCQPLHSYREAVDFVLQTAEIDDTDREALVHGTIQRVLDLSHLTIERSNP